MHQDEGWRMTIGEKYMKIKHRRQCFVILTINQNTIYWFVKIYIRQFNLKAVRLQTSLLMGHLWGVHRGQEEHVCNKWYVMWQLMHSIDVRERAKLTVHHAAILRLKGKTATCCSIDGGTIISNQPVATIFTIEVLFYFHGEEFKWKIYGVTLDLTLTSRAGRKRKLL